jgi:hypothetical protein
MSAFTEMTLVAALFPSALWVVLWASAVIRARRAAAWIRRQADGLAASPAGARSGIPLFVLLPCLEEQGIVDETLNHFSAVWEAFPDATIIAITGESEVVRHQRSGSPAAGHVYTADLVDAWIARTKASRVLRFHEPAASGTKATKLQFALESLRRMHGEQLERSWIGIYDFDSRPPPTTFFALARQLSTIAADQDVAVIQQIPYIGGADLDLAATCSAGFLQAVAHTERTLAVETDIRLRQAGKACWEIRYAMGAGLFVRANALLSVGGFPDYSDDIALGYRLDLAGEPRTVLAVPNFVQPAPSLGAIIRQYRRIYLGIFNFRNEIDWWHQRRPGGIALTYARFVLTNLRSFSNSARFVLAGSACTLAFMMGGPGLGLLLAALFHASEGCACVSYYVHMEGIRKRYGFRATQRRSVVPIVLLGPLYLYVLPVSMLLDHFARRLFSPREAALVAQDKTPRRMTQSRAVGGPP